MSTSANVGKFSKSKFAVHVCRLSFCSETSARCFRNFSSVICFIPAQTLGKLILTDIRVIKAQTIQRRESLRERPISSNCGQRVRKDTMLSPTQLGAQPTRHTYLLLSDVLSSSDSKLEANPWFPFSRICDEGTQSVCSCRT